MGELLTRWAKGIKQITPLQQARMTYHNTWLMLVGILAGIIASAFSITNLWWLEIVLIAALLNTMIIQLGNYQKYSILKKIEEQTNELA